MIKLLYSNEKTNSFRPVPWHWSTDPFPAYRGRGARYTAFQPVASSYQPQFDGKEPITDGYRCPTESVDVRPSRIIETAKRTRLLVPCAKEQDEQILLLTLRGGFRGHYSSIEAVGAEILFRRGGNTHCCPTEHIVARITQQGGYVFAETGRRCGTGLVEIFSWDGYRTMPADEFEAWLEIYDGRAENETE